MKSKKHQRAKRRAAPRQLIAALLRDTSPQMNAVLADLHVLDAAAAGLMAARIRASNQHHQPAWLDAVDEILTIEMHRCANALAKSERTS